MVTIILVIVCYKPYIKNLYCLICASYIQNALMQDGSGASGGVGSFPVKYISSDNDFDSEMGKARDKPTVVEFTADW